MHSILELLFSALAGMERFVLNAPPPRDVDTTMMPLLTIVVSSKGVPLTVQSALLAPDTLHPNCMYAEELRLALNDVRCRPA